MEISAFRAIKNNLLNLSVNIDRKKIVELSALNIAFHIDNGRHPRDALDFGKWIRRADVSRNVDARVLSNVSFEPLLQLIKDEDSIILFKVKTYLAFYREAENLALDKIISIFIAEYGGFSGSDLERLYTRGGLGFDPFLFLDENELAELNKN